MALSNFGGYGDPRDEIYRMKKEMEDERQKMMAEMRYMQGYQDQGPAQKQEATKPEEPRHLNRRLLLTKGT